MVQDCIDLRSNSVATKRKDASGHLVQHDAEGEQIGARVQLLAECLFGRHVSNGTGDRSFARRVLGV